MNQLNEGKLGYSKLNELKSDALTVVTQIIQLEEMQMKMAGKSTAEELVGETLDKMTDDELVDALTGPAGLPPQIDQSFEGKSFTGKAKPILQMKVEAMTFEELTSAKNVQKPVAPTQPIPEPKPVAQASWKWLPVDTKKLKVLPVVKLREAKLMYQPVGGTSAGSRYYLVAGNADLRIAARYKGGTLSLRVEGEGYAKYTNSMVSCGSDLHGEKSHASVHLMVGTDLVLANKTLGALIMGLGIVMETPYPNLSLIKEA